MAKRETSWQLLLPSFPNLIRQRLFLLVLFWLIGIEGSRGQLSGVIPQDRVNGLADLYVKRLFQFNPELGTFYGIDQANHAGLSDNSLSGLKRWHSFEDSLQAALKSIQPQTLTNPQWITYGLLMEELEASINSRICHLEGWKVDQVGGWQVWLDFISKAQPVGNAKHRADTLQRWKKISAYIRNEIQNLKTGLTQGYSAPKQNVRLVLDQMKAILKQPVDSSFFYHPAQRDALPSLGKELAGVIRTEIYPSVAAYRNYLRDEYFQQARTSLSVADLPNGLACYQARLRANTTLKTTPEKVYQEGVQAVSQRETKLKEIGKIVYQLNDLKAIKEQLRSDITNKFTSREELFTFAQAAVQRAKAKIPNYFGLLPKAGVEIQPLPAYQEKAGSSRYTPASDDGSRPATYHLQLYQPKKQTKGSVESTAFHEAYPGHHLQIAIARELGSAHPLSKYIGNSGFSEGWARYSETLADEMQLYSSEKNRLSAYAGLPTGMVVDPGIHLKKWTLEQAIAYVLEKLSDASPAFAEAYVDRIAIWPGQMTTYGMGEIHFKNLRKLAEAKQGTKFNLRQFHDKCLENGTIPLNMLTEQINQWLKEEK